MAKLAAETIMSTHLYAKNICVLATTPSYHQWTCSIYSHASVKHQILPIWSGGYIIALAKQLTKRFNWHKAAVAGMLIQGTRFLVGSKVGLPC